MAVYVDPLMNHGWRLGPSCHMYADTPAELHRMADRIGLKRKWFQAKRLPHYDLTASRRAKAIACGVIEHDRRQAVMMWRSRNWSGPIFREVINRGQSPAEMVMNTIIARDQHEKAMREVFWQEPTKEGK